METTAKKPRALIEPTVRERLARIEKLGVDVSEARTAYEEWGKAEQEAGRVPGPAVESGALEGKKYALEQTSAAIKTALMAGDTSEAAELKARRSALAREIDAAESEHQATRESAAELNSRRSRLREVAEKLELVALEACREKLAQEIEAAVLAEPLCLRFPTETPPEALRLVRLADDLVERDFPLYVPRQDFFDLMAPEVAAALRKAITST